MEKAIIRAIKRLGEKQLKEKIANVAKELEKEGFFDKKEKKA